MKKKSRILVALLSLMMFTFCLCGIASATVSAETSLPPIKSISTESESIVVNTINTQNSLFKQWTCGITDNHNGTVTISGSTTATITVEYLDVKVYLQRLNGSTWVDVTSRTYSDTSSSRVSNYSSVAVTTGYYYRTRSVHTIRNSGQSQSETSVSQAILVN